MPRLGSQMLVTAPAATRPITTGGLQRLTVDDPPPNVTNEIKPSDVGAWTGPGGVFKRDSVRRGREKTWYALTGRVTLVKAERDGDLHIQMVDESADDGDVNVVVEVPAGEPWCDIRSIVFGWTTTKTFPFTASGRALTLTERPIITVVGKAFYDAVHGGKDTTRNRRPKPKNARPTTSPSGRFTQS
jgi:hypothetical protein